MYLVYVPSTRKIISSYAVVFDESFSSQLAYTSQPYSEETAMCLAVTYIPCDTSSREQTGNIISLTQFEEGNILTKTRNNAESSDDDSIVPPLMKEEEMDALDSVNESDQDLISTEMLEDIRDGSQSYPNVTTLFRSNGYVSVCEIYTLCYVFEETNGRYTHVCT